MYTDDDLYNSTLWKNSEIMRNFVDILSKTAEDVPDEPAIDSDSRKPMRGRSVQEITGTDEEIVVYRACDAKCATIKPMDYVTRSKKWAVGHAEHNLAVEESEQHVVYAWVHPKDVFEAPNPGEFFYDGPEAKARRLSLFSNAADAATELDDFVKASALKKQNNLVRAMKEMAMLSENATASYLIERAALEIEGGE